MKITSEVIKYDENGNVTQINPDDFSQEVDELLTEFNAWFVKTGFDPLIRSEKAIVRTVLWWAAVERLKAKDGAAPEAG